MNGFRNAFFIALALGVGAGLPACQKEGPAERAGKQVDKAAEDTSKTVDKLTGKEGPAESAGRKLDESAQKAGEKMKDMGEAVKEKASK
jgi:hyperosmotically inducible protein